MKKFAITANSFIGEIIFTYNEIGYLTNFQNTSDIDEPKQKYILQNLPLTMADMETRFMKSSKVKVIELSMIVTFEMAWKKYADFIRSSKKKSLEIWNKMTETDQVKAYLFIDKYERHRGSAEKKLFETYLRAQQWNN